MKLEKSVVALSDLVVGDKAKIVGYSPSDRHYRRKLLTMGLTLGTELTLVAKAPLGDPIQIASRGLAICLRKSEAHILKLEKVA